MDASPPTGAYDSRANRGKVVEVLNESLASATVADSRAVTVRLHAPRAPDGPFRYMYDNEDEKLDGELSVSSLSSSARPLLFALFVLC